MTSEAHDDFQAMARQLSGRVEGAMAGWRGAGSTAFQQLHASWQEHHGRIAGLLKELESAFVTTDRRFDDTDAAARSGIDGVASALTARLG